MELMLLRYSSGKESTLGLLMEVPMGEPSHFLCYTLEDEPRKVKVPGETCIPAGRYRVTLRKEGGFHARYAKKFPDIHRGMLWIRDVPGFEWILLHCGNTDDDTAGCLLVGDGSHENVTRSGHVSESVKAYRRIYPGIAAALERDEPVHLTVTAA